MHFFAKIFLCGTIVLSMTFLFSGYYFMNYSFEENLEKEKNLVISQYQYDKFTIQTRLLSDENLYEELLQKNSKVTLQRLLEDVEAVSAFYSDNKKVLYSKIQNINKSFIKELSDSTQNYKYYQEEDRYYLLIGSMIDQNHRFYFITKTDISGVLEQQKSLQKQFYKIYGIALGTGVILLFILSVIVTVPLKKITEAANRMAGGSYSERIHIRGNDEIGKLSRSFNVMANAVEDRMKELSEQSERKEEFVENFAHELKTPLTSVIGYADMIYQRDMSRKEIKEAAWFIWNEGMHLEALSHKLMDLTILNKQKFMLWDMGAEEVLGEILKSLQPHFGYELSALHVNHGLRKEAVQEEALRQRYIPSPEQSAAAVSRMMLAQLALDDDCRIQASGLYMDWTPGSYSPGEVRNAGAQTWECYQAHDNAVYPDIAPGNAAWFTFWRPLHGRSAQTARPFVPVQGAHDLYRTGELVVWTDGTVYRCLSDTAYSPADQPGAWERMQEL